jgi:monofunctional biosynthetic peptidoglycan transglycosylase
MKRRVRSLHRIPVAIAGVVFGCLIYLYLTLPDVRPLARENPSTTAFIELRAREARAAGESPRRVHRWVGYSRISPTLKRAVLVAEDAGFWDHEGVDYYELRRSLEIAWKQGTLRGASTITQQLAKNLYLSPSRNPLRKFRELIIARRLEAELEKTRIFELYLNLIEWGDGVYGIDAAADTYFHGTSAGLNPTQSALLAAAIINPRVLNPGKPSARLAARQRLILRRMNVGAVPTPGTGAAPHGPIEEESVAPGENHVDVQAPVEPSPPVPVEPELETPPSSEPPPEEAPIGPDGAGTAPVAGP